MEGEVYCCIESIVLPTYEIKSSIIITNWFGWYRFMEQAHSVISDYQFNLPGKIYNPKIEYFENKTQSRVHDLTYGYGFLYPNQWLVTIHENTLKLSKSVQYLTVVYPSIYDIYSFLYLLSYNASLLCSF